jgi:phosphoribosyl-dephospho-CoA transferase
VVNPVVHDIVELSSGVVTELCGQASEQGQPWVVDSLSVSPWAVTRRASPVDGEHLAIGVRGRHRHQRWGTEVPASACLSVLRPSDLVERNPPRDLPVFRALSLLRKLPFPGNWGPGGSVGAELASGHPEASSTSDLDLVIRVDSVPDTSEARPMQVMLDQVSAQTGVEIDALVETPGGGVSLQELATGVDTAVVRTADGPVPLANLWSLR